MKTTNGQLFRRDSATGAFTSQVSAAIGTKKMNDETFARIVAEDVKNNVTDSQREYLMLPQNRTRWKFALKILVENIDSQIKEINADKDDDNTRYSALGVQGKTMLVEANAAYDAKLNKITRFKFYVESRLNFVDNLVEDESEMSRKELLEAAIHKYLEMLDEMDFERTELDDALEHALINNSLSAFDSVTLEE